MAAVHPIHQTLKLISKDNETFVVDRSLMKFSSLIKGFSSDSHDGEAVCIPVPEVSAPILKKILEWLEHHKDDDENTIWGDHHAARDIDIPIWDAQFLQVSQETLFDLMMALHFLGIQSLLGICCKTVANMAKGKSTEELRKWFNIRK